MPGARIQRGDRIALRTVEREDVPFLQRAFANPEIRYPLGNGIHRTLEEVERRFEDDDQRQFLVCLEPEDAAPGAPDGDEVRPIGAVAITGADWRRPELVYWLVPDVHGDGYGNEAVSMVLEYVFRVYDTPAVGAGVYDHNDASRGLLESLGFTEEGRLRRYMFVDGEYRDLCQYGLLRREWRRTDASNRN